MNENIEMKSSKEWLENLLKSKIEKNSNYSLRAFSKSVGLSPSYLSRVISGERPLTLKSSLKICDGLNFSPIQRENIFSLIHNETGNIKKEKTKESIDDFNLTIDAFHAVSDWYHYGISQLFFATGFIEDKKWIASKLGISELEVKIALERLERLGILKRNKLGKLKKTSESVSTTDGVYSSGLRKFHKQILEKALISLEEDKIEERSVTSITMAINEKNIPKAKVEISKFRQKISKLLERGKKTRIYNLNINLIPLSKSTSEEK